MVAGELQRFGDPNQHRGQGGGDQQAGDLDAIFRRGSEVERQRNPHRTKHFRVTVQSKAALREQRLQRFRTLTERLQMLRPVDLDTAFNNGWPKNKWPIDKVMKPGWDKNAFKEGVHPNAQRARATQEGL